MDLNFSPQQRGRRWVGRLMKDGRTFSWVKCLGEPPIPLLSELHILDPFSKITGIGSMIRGLPFFELHESGAPLDKDREWLKFLYHLHTFGKVGHVYLSRWELLILPPESPPPPPGVATTPIRVCYRPSEVPPYVHKPRPPPLNAPVSQAQAAGLAAASPLTKSPVPPVKSAAQVVLPVVAEKERPAPSEPQVNGAHVHPLFLNSVELTHTDWAFGGMAELIDNARDAGAKRLDVSIEEVKWPARKQTIPIMQFSDNGHGMTHEDIVRMLSFGHDSPSVDNINQIGRFGVGFKAGAVRVGDDVLVLTQSRETRSIGFLSKSYNKGKNELEIPIVTYRNYDGIMELDTTLHTDADESAVFRAVETFSPFNRFRIGSEFDKIGKGMTGTRIFLYNLKTWGGSKCLFEWESGGVGEQSGDGNKNGDITIQGKRIRSRNGQTSTKVPLDYSLRAYVEVMFLVPNMSIYIQGSRVRTVRLADDLHQTKRYRGHVLGKKVHLTLGFRQIEFERGNCGIFLYWHRRLIKAYTRVGRMVHSADYGRGVIRVIDVTDLMDYGNGEVEVLANKQGFQDCEQYVKLEEWLAEKVHEYCDSEDNIEVVNPTEIAKEIANGVKLVADQDWVQCDKCQQWRILPHGITANDLPSEWFCYMEPFSGKCEMPEETVGSDIVTVAVKRGNITVGPPLATPSDQSGVAHTDNVSEESSGFKDIKEPQNQVSSEETQALVFKRTPAKGTPKGVPVGTKEAQKRTANADEDAEQWQRCCKGKACYQSCHYSEVCGTELSWSNPARSD